MKSPLLVLTAVVAGSVCLAAQDVPSRPSEPLPDRYAVTIEGCVYGTLLVPLSQGVSSGQSSILSVAEYRLRGSRSLLRLLREEHDGHHDAITGIVEVPRERQLRAGVFTKEVGKGRLTVGRRERRTVSEESDARRPATLTVQEVRHIADRCTER